MSLPRYLQEAAEAALSRDPSSDVRRALVGCVIVRKDGAVVRARNLAATKRSPRTHAEARCVRKSDVGAVAYVARVTRDGTVKLARPCRTCAAALASRGVVAVVYTVSDDEWERIEL